MVNGWSHEFATLVGKYRDRILASDIPAGTFPKKEATKTGALPVHGSIGGSYLIDEHGRVLELNDSTNAISEVVDDKQVLLALVAAAEQYPEFKKLLPKRDSAARDCDECNGEGFLVLANVRLRCGKCLGLGWLSPELARFHYPRWP